MYVWRICKKQHLESALSGIGAAESGGRWNHRGERMVYASSSLSLATLELFVHLEPGCLPDDLIAIEAMAPEDASIEKLTIAQLPKNWRDYPAPASLQDLGTAWLREQRTLLLLVPSAVNPEENNVLINPLHPETTSIAVSPPKSFQFDPRMWK